MMTGRKEPKAEKSSSQRSGGGNGGGGSNVSETGALFPRLHVKETKRVGPRAPPRNKMALYEQFTFPSSRFMPPSLPLPASGRPAATPAPTTTYGSQRSSYEGSLLYGLPPSLNGMPWMPYTAVNTASASVNGSSNSTVVDCEKELQQRPGVPESSTRQPSNAVGQGSSWVPSQSNVSNVSCKTPRSNDDCTVPALTPLSSSYGPSVPTVRTNQHPWQAWPQRSIDTSNTCQQVSVSSGCQVESSGLASLRTRHGTYSVSVAGRADGEGGRDVPWKSEKKAQVEEESELRECTNDEIERDSIQMRSSDAEVSESHRHASKRYRHHGQKASQSEALNCSSKGPKSCAIVSRESLAASDSDGQGSLQQKKLSAMVKRSADLSTKTGKVGKGEVEGKEMKEKPSSDARNRRKRGNPSECKSSSLAGGDDELELVSTAKASEPSQSDAWSDGAESNSAMSGQQEAPQMFRRTSSNHMINIIGEQEFWKTRKLLQRQQKIFSEQIFELHRVIKVQQLLASSADVLMDEGMLGDCDEIAEASPEPADTHETHIADDEDDEEDDAYDTETIGGEQEVPKSAMGKHPDSTCQSSTSPRMRAENPFANPVAASDRQKGEVPGVPIITPGESSASWAGTPFPKAGVNNWFGAVPAPSGAYVYQPYPSPFHPPPAHAMGGYNGAYRPLMCAPGPMDAPSLNPYCMPRFEQPDLMQDMYRYNPYSQQWPPAMVCQPVGSNPGASWYGVPPPLPFLDPGLRGPYGWYEDVASGAHPAGPNYLRPAHQSSAQGMPVPRPPAFVVQPPWTDVSNSQQQTGNDGEGFRHQAPWARLGESGQPASPASQRPPLNPPCQEGGKLVSHQSDAGIQRPPHSSGDNNSTGSGVPKGVAGTDYGWEQSEDNICRDQGRGTPEMSAGDHNTSVDKSEERALKRSKVSRPESRDLGGADEIGQNVEFTTPVDCGRALPLFPLGPALNTGENRKLSSQSFEVIKAVPRAMVATAESAAEILLSIQKQRQQ